MKDIDFDELDRAVGSVLGTTEATKSVANESTPAPMATASAQDEPLGSSCTRLST